MTQSSETRTISTAVTARDLMSACDGSIAADATLREVIDRFLNGSSRHLVVADGDGRCLGVLGPRHIAQAHRLDLRHDHEIPVKDLGYASWIALDPGDDVRTCARMLVEYDLDAIPVLDAERRVLGLVTMNDIARATASMSS